MAIWLVILLGAVQGLTEFLPVSSSGHLLLLQRGLGDVSAKENMYFDLALHVGSAFAVIVAYRTKILSLFRKGNRNGHAHITQTHQGDLFLAIYNFLIQ
jgi:undecaprenyl-diphosphatase